MISYNKAFFATRGLLVSLLFLVPKQFDTSSEIIFPEPRGPVSFSTAIVVQLVRKICIWDTVFYISAANRGTFLYEHEWAFGLFWSKLIRWLTPEALFAINTSLKPIYYYAIVGILVANVCHYLAGLMLAKLTRVVYREAGESKNRDAEKFASNVAIAFACSPAGMFLLSSYAEPIFALISFTAMYCRSTGRSWLAAFLFAFSCGFRSNGLLWGIYYLSDLYSALLCWKLWGVAKAISQGTLVGAVYLGIQALAYKQFCPSASDAPGAAEWCTNSLPLIYPYIQSQYWNIGFLRYWSPNNIPNFLFGLPTLLIMANCTRSKSFWRLEKPLIYIHTAMPVMALFFWHFQIITRVSTCLPTIYWYIAEVTTEHGPRRAKTILTLYIATWLVVQGILFSAYLPPA